METKVIVVYFIVCCVVTGDITPSSCRQYCMTSHQSVVADRTVKYHDKHVALSTIDVCVCKANVETEDTEYNFYFHEESNKQWRG